MAVERGPHHHAQWTTKKWKMHIQANIDKLPLDKVVFLSRSLGSVVASCVASEDKSVLRLIWFAHLTCMSWTKRLLIFFAKQHHGVRAKMQKVRP